MDFPQRRTVDEQKARAEAEGWGYDGTMRTEREVLDLLYTLVCVEKPEVCVETGTYQAHGTEAIARALDANDKGHLWTVEKDSVFEYSPHDRIDFVRGDSVEWSASSAPDGIDFAFTDCGPPDIRIEVARNLWPSIRTGGLLLCHDTTFYDKQFLLGLENAVGQRASIVFEALNGLAIWRKA